MSHNDIPRIVRHGSGKQLTVDGKAFLMLAGELHNSTTSSLEYARPIWPRLAEMHLNTVIAPVYWECIEPAEGRFDFTLVDGMLADARAHHLRLVPLWFGTWKNAESSYVPAWVKTDVARCPRMRNQRGESIHSISPFADAAREADARAFAAFMRHLREVDSEEKTVLAVQVENEPGILGSPRDYSPAADAAFARPAPRELMDALAARRDELPADFRAVWAESLFRTEGTWSEVFGKEADEPFMAWHVGRYIDAVAAAGKEEYALPLYANAWLPRPYDPRPGIHPSGGPVPRMLPVWQAAAPHIDLLAPDIYDEDFRGFCEKYDRLGNPLFIPEARKDARAVVAAFYALAEHNAICFAPFGIDDLDASHPLATSYAFLGEMLPLIAERQGTGTMRGIYQQRDQESWDLEFARFTAHVETRQPIGAEAARGGGLIIALSDEEFLIAGRELTFRFQSRDCERPRCEFVWSDEGVFDRGKWIAGRRLNGDESGHGKWINLPGHLAAVRIKLHAFQ